MTEEVATLSDVVGEVNNEVVEVEEERDTIPGKDQREIWEVDD